MAYLSALPGNKWSRSLLESCAAHAESNCPSCCKWSTTCAVSQGWIEREHTHCLTRMLADAMLHMAGSFQAHSQAWSHCAGPWACHLVLSCLQKKHLHWMKWQICLANIEFSSLNCPAFAGFKSSRLFPGKHYQCSNEAPSHSEIG